MNYFKHALHWLRKKFIFIFIILFLWGIYLFYELDSYAAQNNRPTNEHALNALLQKQQESTSLWAWFKSFWGCSIPYNPDFPDCRAKIEWLKKSWRSNPLYANFGVDGSSCSIVIYLSEVEAWCPLLEGREPKKSNCLVPDVVEFPECKKKVEWMKKFWTIDPCYANLGVNGSLCSFLVYLSEYERWCPMIPGSLHHEMRNKSSFTTQKPQLSQNHLGELKKLIGKTGESHKTLWIIERISRLWVPWLNALNSLKSRIMLDSYPRKNILIFIGLLANDDKLHFSETANKGGPLGELMQWADLIASLHLLGHNLTLCVSKDQSQSGIENVLPKSYVNGFCPSTEPPLFDIIYTDYMGISHIVEKYQIIDKIKCQLRIVDSFGTEAEFNTDIKMIPQHFGYLGLNLQQYNTMFPHSPDNSFLGFVVESHLAPGEILSGKKPKAVVYGKDIAMWNDPKKLKFLEVVQKYFEVHATVGNPHSENAREFKMESVLPKYVINHGVLQSKQLHDLLKESLVFVGLGFPYEGPAPLEAIADGCFFLNPKFSPPIGRNNHFFFKNKPTNRKLTSQHPYAERFIGKPYVFTVDVDNTEDVENALKQMKSIKLQPYLPFEFSHEGMLERLFAFTKYHNFCTNQIWPPISSRQIFKGKPGESCEEVCFRRNLLCEPAFFPSINASNNFLTCVQTSYEVSIIAPAMIDDKCILQSNQRLFSCTGKRSSASRLCPCRDFIKGQFGLSTTALLDDIIS